MDMLPHRHLTTLTLSVDFAQTVSIGLTPMGHRGIAMVTGGSFEGERLRGTVRPGHDWFVSRSDGALLIDVRLTLITNDDATIYLAYAGRMVGPGDAMARFRSGEHLPPEDYSLTMTARFECGALHYSWLNDAIVVGIGTQTLAGPIYTMFEVGR